MTYNNKISTEFEISGTENEEYLKNKFDKYNYEISNSIDMKLLTLYSNKSPSYYDQPSANIVKLQLLNSPEKYSHASQFTKHISFMTLEGDTLLQIQK